MGLRLSSCRTLIGEARQGGAVRRKPLPHHPLIGVWGGARHGSSPSTKCGKAGLSDAE
jgi:hypothetical protein